MKKETNMILPPQDVPGNKLSRKSQRKALEKATGKAKKKRKKPKQPSPTAKVARRGGMPIEAPPALDQLAQVNVNAAGIDVGATVHVVAVPSGRDADSDVRSFGTFTADLEGIADWLEACGIETVAMESTGVYWIPLYELLERRGFEVLLINPSDVKKFRRKTDVLDSQWLQTLHTFGLLAGSFRPEDKILELRSYLRQRDTLVKSSADTVRRMQKALEQMNIKLTEVVSDITGVTGMAILRAVLSGERNPQRLAELRDGRCKNDEATIALALQGNWRMEHLFALRQAVELYDVFREKLAQLDEQIEAYLKTFEDKSDGETLKPLPRKKPLEPRFNVRDLMHRMTGVDLTEVDGIGGYAAMKIVSEIGTDMSQWESDKHFTSWLCLCPEVNLSGGSRKSRRSRTQPSSNRVAAVLRMGAESLLRADCALGAFGRRLRAKKGGPHAVTAVARKLAIIVYHMLKEGRPYQDRGAAYYDEQYRKRVIKNLRRRASELGFELIAASASA
jgi:transposase